jgi:hypothetical protein
MVLAIEQATFDFESPTLLYLNKNYLFKFDTSILSLSVTATLPLAEQPIPIKAKALIYSHPKAPAPTRKVLTF